MVISDEQHLKYLENLKTVEKKKQLGGKGRKPEVSRVLQIAGPRLVNDSAFYSFFRTDDLSDHPANFCPPPRPEACSLYSQPFYILKHTPLIHTGQQLYTTPGSDQSELTFWVSFLTVLWPLGIYLSLWASVSLPVKLHTTYFLLCHNVIDSVYKASNMQDMLVIHIIKNWLAFHKFYIL